MEEKCIFLLGFLHLRVFTPWCLCVENAPHLAHRCVVQLGRGKQPGRQRPASLALGPPVVDLFLAHQGPLLKRKLLFWQRATHEKYVTSIIWIDNNQLGTPGIIHTSSNSMSR